MSLSFSAQIDSPFFEDATHYRKYLEDLLVNNRIKLLVATIALGMGFDKPDIGFVIHYQVGNEVEIFTHHTARYSLTLQGGPAKVKPLTFLLVTVECIGKIQCFLAHINCIQQQVV